MYQRFHHECCWFESQTKFFGLMIVLNCRDYWRKQVLLEQFKDSRSEAKNCHRFTSPSAFWEQEPIYPVFSILKSPFVSKTSIPRQCEI